MDELECDSLLLQLHGVERIVIVGTTGAGKTTLSKALSRIMGLPRSELDSFRHEANWVEADDSVFRARVADAINGDQWIVDGNYGIARDLIWPRAEVLIWLDYSFASNAYLKVIQIKHPQQLRDVLAPVPDRSGLKAERVFLKRARNFSSRFSDWF